MYLNIYICLICNCQNLEATKLDWMQSRKWQNDLCSFPRQTIQHHGNPSLCPNHWCQRSWSWLALWRPTVPSRTNTKKVMCFSSSLQFSSVAQSCPTLCDPMNRSMPGLPAHQQLLEFTQTHAHQVSDAIQPSHLLSSPSPPAPNPSQHQGLFQWVNSSHEVAKVLEFQLQHQSFQWTPRTDLL